MRYVTLDMTQGLRNDEAGGVVTLQKTIDEMGLGASKETLSRLLHLEGIMLFKSLKKVPHQVGRQVPKKSYQLPVFSDEKKFSLDGPNGYRRQWVNTRQPKRFLTESAVKLRSLNVWAGFLPPDGLIAIFEKNENAAPYHGFLRSNLFPYMRRRRNMMFQQGNALSHTTRSTKRLLGEQKLWPMDLPANSPDLNPIKSVWGLVTHLIYRVDRRPRSLDELAVTTPLYSAEGFTETTYACEKSNGGREAKAR